MVLLFIMNYFELPGVSQSFLKQLDSSPFLAKKMLDGEKENKKGRRKAFDFGSLVDLMITQPDEKVEDHFYLLEGNRPTGKLHDLLVWIEKNDKPYNKESIQEAIDDIGFGGSNWKKETILEKLKPLIQYVEDLGKAGDKAIMSSIQLKTAENVVTSLKLDNITSPYLFSKNSNYQYVIQEKILGIECKCMIDNLIIDENKKEITIVDLKTMEGYTTSFQYSFFKFRYDIQAAFYSDLVAAKFPGYTIKGFYFVVGSSSEQGRPLVFKASSAVLKMGRGGAYYKGAWYKGYKELLFLYNYREDNNEWELPIEYEKNGYALLSSEDIK